MMNMVYWLAPRNYELLQGFVDDYVYTVQACLDLYTATLSESWLHLALKLQEEQDRLFLDTEVGEQDDTGHWAEHCYQ